MDNKIIYGFLTILVGVILLGSVLVPIIDNPAITKTKVVATNENAEYTVSQDYSDGVTIEMVDGVTTNGTAIPLANNPAITVFTDRFSVVWYKSETSKPVCDVGLGVVSDVKAIRINTDGTYEFTKTDDSTVTSSDAISWAFYPAIDGEYGAFSTTAIVDKGESYYTTYTNIGGTPWYYMILNLECNEAGISATEKYLAKTTSDSFQEVTVSVAYDNYTPEGSTDGLSYIVSNPQSTRTVTVDGTDYTFSKKIDPIIAPLEYHVYEDVVVDSSLYGVIPILVAIAILMAAVRIFILRRED